MTGIVFSVILIFAYLIMNFLSEKFFVSLHEINLNGLKGNMFEMNVRFIILPLIQGILVFDLVFGCAIFMVII